MKIPFLLVPLCIVAYANASTNSIDVQIENQTNDTLLFSVSGSNAQLVCNKNNSNLLFASKTKVNFMASVQNSSASLASSSCVYEVKTLSTNGVKGIATITLSFRSSPLGTSYGCTTQVLSSSYSIQYLPGPTTCNFTISAKS